MCSVSNTLCSLNAITDTALKFARYPIEYRGFGILFKLTTLSKIRNLTIGEIQRLLSRRDSSRLEDETVAIAPLLNIEASELTKVNDKDRMARFWRLLGRIPSNTIFLRCPRLEEPGLTWAPKSLMAITVGASMDTTSDAMIADDGLRGTFLVYKFRTQGLIDISPSYILDHDAQQFIAFTIIKGNDGYSGVFHCDAIVAQQRPQQASGRIHAVALLADPSGSSKFPRYRYGNQLFLDLRPFHESLLEVYRQVTFPCSSQAMEIVIS